MDKPEDVDSERQLGDAPERPPFLMFFVWWFVFVGVYQIFFAWRFGTFYEGTQGDLRKLYGGVAMEPLYAAIGILAFVVAWGAWRMRPWAYRLGWVLQVLLFVVVLGGIVLWLTGRAAPIGWLLVDALFGVANVWWLLTPATRQAFTPRR